MKSLGKLEKVELREIWQTEGQDFTPWLAREENLEMLGEVIGIELNWKSKRKISDRLEQIFYAKIPADNIKFLIENQI